MLRPNAAIVACSALTLVFLGCGSGPSRAQALEVIQSGVREEGSCTLPVAMLRGFKMQHATKGICVPKEGGPELKACIDALVAANITRRMPDAYMVAWPDDVSGASFQDIPAYDRRPRNLVYSTCVELAGELRGGRFTCADAKVEKVLQVTARGPAHADVLYAREIVVRPTLAAIDAACGAVSRPPADATVSLAKGEKGWALASGAESTPPVIAH